MSQSTNIEWTDATWNPVRGCSRVSEGCRNCYAERIAARFSGSREWGAKGGPLKRGGTTDKNGIVRMDPFFKFATITAHGPHWTGKVELIESKLLEPLHWKKPRRVFVNSMSDLFHENLPFEQIDRVFAVMALTPHITYQVLTKRARRMREYFLREQEGPFGAYKMVVAAIVELNRQVGIMGHYKAPAVWPLPNVWLGVSVENQPTADERIPELLRTPAALRFVSYEPALAGVNWKAEWLYEHFVGADGVVTKRPTLGWGIIGGESGPGARPFALEWARNTIRQFKAAGVPLFCKQLGSKPVGSNEDLGRWRVNAREDLKGGNWDYWPQDLRVRQFPEPLAGPVGGRR